MELAYGKGFLCVDIKERLSALVPFDKGIWYYTG